MLRQIRRRPAALAPSSPSAAALHSDRRLETTGSHHSFQPGPITKGLRFLFALVTPKRLMKRIAMRMQRGMEQVEAMEKEHRWMKLHGTPLKVLGVPEHADLAEVKARYRDLVLDLHPDTARQAAAAAAADTAAASSAVGLPADGTIAAGSPGNAMQSAAVANVLALQVEADRRADEFERIQTAYKMLTNPDSVFYQSGSAIHLHEELGLALRSKKGNARRHVRKITKIGMFGLFAIVLFLMFLVFVSVKGLEKALLEVVRFHDPRFYEYFMNAEAEEARLEALGEVVNRNPKRFAPTKMQRLLYPGQFIDKDSDDDDDDD